MIYHHGRPMSFAELQGIAMLQFEQAESLAKEWISVASRGTCRIIEAETITKTYGWIFFYQGEGYFKDPQDFNEMVLGNAPILVEKFTAKIVVTVTHSPIEKWLEAYESKLPSAWLQSKPEPAGPPHSIF